MTSASEATTYPNGSVDVTITDNDPPPNIFVDDLTVNETIGTAMIRVWMDRVSAKPVSVDYELENHTAVSLWDYHDGAGTVSFSPGDTEAYVSVTISNDILAEDDEDFYINLSNETNAVISDNQGVVTIISEDLDPFVYIDDVTVTEGDAGDNVMAIFTVSLSGPSGRPIQVTAQADDDTAIAGDDYDATDETIAFELGLFGQMTTTLSQQFIVPIVEDLVYEPIESFLVSLFGLTGPGFPDSKSYRRCSAAVIPSCGSSRSLHTF